MISSELKSDIIEHGYSLVPALSPNASTIEIAGMIGDPLTPWEGGLVQTLSPHAEAPPNTYSGNFGLGRFPFHTDLAHWRRPPRYLLLRCVVGYRDVPTMLVDGLSLVSDVSRDILARAIFRPRRPRDGEFSLLRLFEPSADGDDLLRWDELFLQPASKVGDAANTQVRDWLGNCAPMSVSLFRPGDTLIVDNCECYMRARQFRKGERIALYNESIWGD